MLKQNQPNKTFQRSSQIKEISSTQNQLIKDIALLGQKAKERREKGLFIVEGLREVERAVISGWKCNTILFEQGFFSQTDIDIWMDELKRKIYHRILSQQQMINPSSSQMLSPELQEELEQASQLLKHIQWIECTAHVFEKIAYRKGVSNWVAVFEIYECHLEDIQIDPSTNPLVLVLENVEKSGNLGAILRTANAMGVNAVLVCDDSCDLFNPNTIRNSLGGFFDLDIVHCSSEEAIHWLKEKQLQILVTYLENGQEPSHYDLRQPTALVLGAEDQGISELWRSDDYPRVRIDMQGVVDSLNVSVSTGMLLYEAHRQRKKA
jgi:TrmH family RNA methyltransferase